MVVAFFVHLLASSTQQLYSWQIRKPSTHLLYPTESKFSEPVAPTTVLSFAPIIREMTPLLFCFHVHEGLFTEEFIESNNRQRETDLHKHSFSTHRPVVPAPVPVESRPPLLVSTCSLLYVRVVDRTVDLQTVPSPRFPRVQPAMCTGAGSRVTRVARLRAV